MPKAQFDSNQDLHLETQSQLTQNLLFFSRRYRETKKYVNLTDSNASLFRKPVGDVECADPSGREPAWLPFVAVGSYQSNMMGALATYYLALFEKLDPYDKTDQDDCSSASLLQLSNHLVDVILDGLFALLNAPRALLDLVSDLLDWSYCLLDTLGDRLTESLCGDSAYHQYHIRPALQLGFVYLGRALGELYGCYLVVATAPLVLAKLLVCTASALACQFAAQFPERVCALRP